MQVTRVLRATGVFLVAGLLYGSAAIAQTGVVIGTVTDAQNSSPIADVVVTARSPNLQGEQVIVTDSTGSYRIPQLPPGVYTLNFQKEGYKPFERGDITLRIDRTVRVNVQMLPSTLEETYTIQTQAPTIDVGSTTTGVAVGEDFIRRIAVNRPGGKGGATRSFEQLAELAPGAQNDTYGVSLNGATSPENGYIVDGLSTNDPAFGINASPLSVEFVEDVNIITGGYLPEYGRSTGGVVTAVTKSGSNEFHGSFFANWTPGSLEGDRKDIPAAASTIFTKGTLGNLGDFGATLGGPIIKDKLWFFAGVAPSYTRFKVNRELRTLLFQENADGTIATDADGPIPVNIEGTEFQDSEVIEGTQRTFFADSRAIQYQGKLTYLLNADHNVSLSVFGTPSSSGGRGKGRVSSRTGGAGIDATNPGNIGLVETLASSTASNLRYAGSFLEKKVLFDANLGWFHQNASTLPVDGTEPGDRTGLAGQSRVWYNYYDTVLRFERSDAAATACNEAAGEEYDRCPVSPGEYELGGPGFISRGSLDRYQGQGKLTFLLNAVGQHVIKTGVDIEQLNYSQKKAYTGGAYFVEVLPAGTPGSPAGAEPYTQDYRRYGFQTSPDSAETQFVQDSKTSSLSVGGYLQDSWSIAQRLTLNLGVRYDQQNLYGGDGELALVLANQWSPRLGVILDPLGTGQMKFFANYANYYEQVPLNLLDRAFPPERRFTGVYACDAAANPGACEANQLPFTSRPQDPSRFDRGGKVQNEPVDPDLKPQSSNEIVLGGEYEVLPFSRLGVTYTRRRMGDVIEDMSRDDGNTYFLGNPGQGFAKEFPRPERKYDAVTVSFNRSFNDGWLAQVSYTYSKLRGNYPGLFRPETAQLDPNILSDFDLISLLPNRYGALPFDRTHGLKVFGAKEFAITDALSTSLGLSYRGNSGTPINAYGAHPEYGPDEAFFLKRGSVGRTPFIHTIDSNLGVNYKLAKDNVVTFTLDVFNLFNFQKTAAVDQSFTYASILPCTAAECTVENLRNNPGIATMLDSAGEEVAFTKEEINPNYGNPTAYQAPRQIRFGVRYTF